MSLLIFGPAGPGSRQLRAAATKPSNPGDTTTNHGDNRVQGRATYGALPSHQGTRRSGKIKIAFNHRPGARRSPTTLGTPSTPGTARTARTARTSGTPSRARARRERGDHPGTALLDYIDSWSNNYGEVDNGRSAGIQLRDTARGTNNYGEVDNGRSAGIKLRDSARGALPRAAARPTATARCCSRPTNQCSISPARARTTRTRRRGELPDGTRAAPRQTRAANDIGCRAAPARHARAQGRRATRTVSARQTATRSAQRTSEQLQ